MLNMKGVQDLTTNKEYNKRLVQLLEGYEIKDLLNGKKFTVFYATNEFG